MTYVVTQHCVDCRYTDCVSVCPVDAFHLGPRMVYINPDTCVACDACVPACPVEAIYAEDSVPEKWKVFIQANADGAKNYPMINQQQPALPSARSLEELKQQDPTGGVVVP